jgi:hypothetical protein
MTQGGETVPPSSTHPANPPTIHGATVPVLLESEANPYGGTVPTFTGAESERRLRVNAGVYDRVKAGDDLLQILTTCCILHNVTIEDKEEV